MNFGSFNFANLFKIQQATALAILKNVIQVTSRTGNLPNIADVIRAGKSKADIKCNLAAAYGSLDKGSFQRMDKELKVIIGYTIGLLSSQSNLSWDNVIRCMNSNNLIKQMPGSSVHRSDGMSKGGTNAFKCDGSPDNSIVREVHSWFVRLVSDSNVLKDTGIDIDVLGRLVAESGASIDSFGAFFHKKVSKSKDVMDVSILRFPDIENPYFKVYRIRLRAWRESERWLFVQKDRSGINGEYNSICYVPRPETIAKLSKKVIDEAVNEAENLFK